MNHRIKSLKQFFSITVAVFAFAEAMQATFGGKPAEKLREMHILHTDALGIIADYEKGVIPEEEALVLLDMKLAVMESMAEKNSIPQPTPNFPLGGHMIDRPSFPGDREFIINK